MSRLTRRELPTADLLFRDAHVFDPVAAIDKRMDVLVRGGVIAELASSGTLTADNDMQLVDAAGMHLFPAFFDPHVHLRTPGQEHKENHATGTSAAAAGGYCGVIAMPNTSPVIDSVAVLRALIERAADECLVPTGFMAAVTSGLEGSELTGMASLRSAGAIGFTDDGRPVHDAEVLRRALRTQHHCGGTVALHEEDLSLAAGGHLNEGRVSTALGISGIPAIAESAAIARDCEIARYEDARIHVQHVSAAASVAAIAHAKAMGTKVTAEASPHHLLLTEEAVRGGDTHFKMNPPLRTEIDRQAVVAGLIDGTLDVVATDHAPHAPDEKEVPFEQAPMGTTGLECAFSAIYTGLVEPGMLPLATLIDRMTIGAELFEERRPKIGVGEPANLVLIELDREWTVGADRKGFENGYQSRSQNCCFAGRKLKAQIQFTVAAGSVVFDHLGSETGEPLFAAVAG